MARSVSLAGGVGQGTVIRVAIVADIRLYREGLARILERQPNISVVATAATSDGSLAPLSQLAPDLILIDMAMPDSRAAIRRVAVAAPGAKVVSLSVREGEDHGDVLASAEAGAIAYVPREASLEDLVAVIECAVRGEAVCSPRVAGALLRRIAALATDGSSERVPARLTKREREIMGLIDEASRTRRSRSGCGSRWPPSRTTSTTSWKSSRCTAGAKRLRVSEVASPAIPDNYPTRPIGNRRLRFPVPAKTALHTAGAMGGSTASPPPLGGASLGTKCTSISGISASASIR